MHLWQQAHRTLSSTFLILLMTLTPCGTSDVYTSTSKILELASSEGSLLDALNKYISAEYDNLKMLSQFLSDRSKAHHLSLEQNLRQLAEHPNGAYYLIKLFYRQWTRLVQRQSGFWSHLKNPVNLPDEKAFRGSLGSLIRLQRVYHLSVHHMYVGIYLGYPGPALELEDAYLLGQQAFMDGYLQECIQWLLLTMSLLHEAKEDPSAGQDPSSVTLARTAALLGRAYLFAKNKTKAQELYELSSQLEPQAGDVTQLKKELDGEEVVYKQANKSWENTMSELCLRAKHHIVGRIRPMHVCRYKMALGMSYLKYKEEILSIEPYVSLFYDAVRDPEIEVIKQHVKGKLSRAHVGQGNEAKADEIRTSDLGWIHDRELSTVASLSQRVKMITGLEVDQRYPHGPSSAEAMQVVNYGLGGHYGAHMDPFEKAPAGDELLNRSGFRIATFLMYLSDVEKGGNTVFLNSGISVAPKKGMALFWYNFTPAMVKDELTMHAGCPVLIGEKWIANKWMWTYGNTFHRPCGPHPNSTQLHVEKLLHPSFAAYTSAHAGSVPSE